MGKGVLLLLVVKTTPTPTLRIIVRSMKGNKCLNTAIKIIFRYVFEIKLVRKLSRFCSQDVVI